MYYIPPPFKGGPGRVFLELYVETYRECAGTWIRTIINTSTITCEWHLRVKT